jgi:regulator of protease activity HflC (stomatin/prohibitin superfamily)
MQFPWTAEQLSQYIALAIGYAIILTLFLKSRRDVKRFHGQAEAASGVSNLSVEGQGIRPPVEAATAQRHRMAARAELLRTYRRAEMAPRIAAPLAAGERR